MVGEKGPILRGVQAIVYDLWITIVAFAFRIMYMAFLYLVISEQ